MTFPSASNRLCGVIHLGPTPGSDRWAAEGSMASLMDAALRDARAYLDGGVRTLVVENFGDAPFPAGRVSPGTVAALTLAVQGVRELDPELEVGVNVLRTDASSAVGIAAATGASFIRVNVHTGSMYTDQGFIEGRARETLLERARLAPGLRILADVHVKHAVPVPGERLEDATRDVVLRGRADGVIVSGAATGSAPDGARIERVAQAAGGRVPVLIGSGFSVEAAAEQLAFADGAIVGTAAKQGGDVYAPVDVSRVAALVEAAGRARS